MSHGYSTRHWLLMASLAATSVLASANAQAARFQVSPVRLALSDRASSGLLSVQNQSPEPLRFQVGAYGWQQSNDGEMRLAETKDIAFFPSMITVKAGESRKIRVGSLVAQGTAEKTYRVFVEELPPLRRSSGGATGVQVLTRMGIPVFLAARVPSPIPSIDGLALRNGRLVFVVRNRGNTHFLNRTLQISATDAVGKVTYETSFAGWYVLGSGLRAYDLELPSTACGELARVKVVLDTDQGPASASLSANPSQCAP